MEYVIIGLLAIVLIISLIVVRFQQNTIVYLQSNNEGLRRSYQERLHLSEQWQQLCYDAAKKYMPEDEYQALVKAHEEQNLPMGSEC